MTDELGIPLKRAQETFVDEPKALNDVGIDELTFDIKHKIKDLDKLHVYHAISIFKQTLEDIIQLQNHREPGLLREFRRAQLAHLGIDLDLFGQHQVQQTQAHQTNSQSHSQPRAQHRRGDAKVTSMSTPPVPDTPPCSPPLKFARLNDNFNEIKPVRESTPDSLLDDAQTAAADGSLEPQTIAIETLLKTTNILDSCLQTDAAYTQSFENELVYHSSAKIKQQNLHILRGFGLAKRPLLSIEEFLCRVQTYSSSISVAVYVHAAYLMFKLCILLDVVHLTELNVYRFILASIRCLTKKLEDMYQKQKVFATVGGVSQRDLFKIEVGFLYLSNFKIMVSSKRLEQFVSGQYLDLREYVATMPGGEKAA